MNFISATFWLQNTPLFTIYSGSTPIIHTFSREKYSRSCDWLEKESRQSVKIVPPENHPLGKSLPQILAGELRLTMLPPSPFLRIATPFQRKVWELLLAIPHGETRTYGDLAVALGGKGYARPVGQACNANPLALLIPCHRVVGAQGLGGYAGGLPLKQYLLALEKQTAAGVAGTNPLNPLIRTLP
ncbi:methylated-DNA--[protein]-cysteine S-methyltransferase [Thiovibrio sp. JS02]